MAIPYEVGQPSKATGSTKTETLDSARRILSEFSRANAIKDAIIQEVKSDREHRGLANTLDWKISPIEALERWANLTIAEHQREVENQRILDLVENLRAQGGPGDETRKLMTQAADLIESKITRK